MRGGGRPVISAPFPHPEKVGGQRGLRVRIEIGDDFFTTIAMNPRGLIESTKKDKEGYLKTIQIANIGQHRQGSFVTIFC